MAGILLPPSIESERECSPFDQNGKGPEADLTTLGMTCTKLQNSTRSGGLLHFASHPGSFFFYLITGAHGLCLLGGIAALVSVGFSSTE